MNARVLVLGLALVFVGALSEVFSAFWSVPAAFVAAVLLAAGPPLLTRVFHLDDYPIWAAVAFPAIGALAGAAIAWMTGSAGAVVLLCPFLTAGTGLGWAAARRLRHSQRCSLCNAPLAGALSFECPRCALTVCESRCWRPEFLRCRLCLDNEVPIFTPDARWWDQQTTARMKHGSCQVCQARAEERDLRGCRRCGRPQCTGCWDHLNGQCSRCQWTIRDVPEPLAKFLNVPETVTSHGQRSTTR